MPLFQRCIARLLSFRRLAARPAATLEPPEARLPPLPPGDDPAIAGLKAQRTHLRLAPGYLRTGTAISFAYRQSFFARHHPARE